MNRFVPSLLAALLAAAPAAAGPDDPAKVELLAGWRQADGTHMAALRITMADGWHTYWRAPGEAGIPPEFDWSGSDNLAEVRLHWPVPEIFFDNGMTTLGYTHELVLPVEVVAVDPGAEVTLKAHMLLGVCHDICMPMEAEVAGVLPDAGTPDRAIEFALAQRPDTGAEAGLVSARCAVEPIADGMRVTAKIELPALGPGEHAVIEPADREIWASEAMVHRSQNLLVAETDLVPPSGQPFDLDPRSLRLTVLAQGRAVDIAGCSLIR